MSDEIDNMIESMKDVDMDFKAMDMGELTRTSGYMEIIKEPCEDCISRQAVKEQMIKYGFHAPDMTVTEFVEDLPPVNPQPKTGHWIGDKTYPICPKCNCNIIEEYISCSDYAEMYKPMNYCPNCGACMKDGRTLDEFIEDSRESEEI